MKRERVLELIDRWLWWYGLLRDIVRELGEEVKFSDVWSRCMQGRDEEVCLGVAMALAVAVRSEGERVDVFKCEGCGREEFKVVEGLFDLLGVQMMSEDFMEVGIEKGYRGMILEGLTSIVTGRREVDVGRWLDWCVKVFSPVDCVMSAEKIVAVRKFVDGLKCIVEKCKDDSTKREGVSGG